MSDTPVSPAAKGLAVSAIIVIYSIVITKMGQLANPDLAIVPFGILLVAVVLGDLYFAKQMGGKADFKSIFIHGFKMAALVGAVIGLWVALSLKFNFFGVLDQALESARKLLEKSGTMDKVEIEEHLAGYKNGTGPMSAIMNVVGYLFVGAIGSLIGAVFANKNDGVSVKKNEKGK